MDGLGLLQGHVRSDSEGKEMGLSWVAVSQRLFSVVSINLGEALSRAPCVLGTGDVLHGPRMCLSQWEGSWKGANIVAFSPANSIYFMSTYYYVASTVLGKCSALLQFT